MKKYPQNFILQACDPGCNDTAHNHPVTLETIAGIDFSCHFEDGAIVIDRCEGMTPEEGLSLFPAWALEAICQNS